MKVTLTRNVISTGSKGAVVDVDETLAKSLVSRQLAIMGEKNIKPEKRPEPFTPPEPPRVFSGPAARPVDDEGTGDDAGDATTKPPTPPAAAGGQTKP